MSRVAKFRRQVSEDPDIDSLLSTLSPEEMEQLEKELDAGDPDAGLSAGLRRDQTERASSQREAEREKRAQAVEKEKASQKTKEEKKKDEKVKATITPDPGPSKTREEAKDSKTKEKKDPDKPKDDRVSKMRERFRQDKNSSTTDKEKPEKTSSKKQEEEIKGSTTDKEKPEKTPSKKQEEEKISKQTVKEKVEKVSAVETKAEKKVQEKQTDKKKVTEVENKQETKKVSEKPQEKQQNLEKIQTTKNTPQGKPPVEQDKKIIKNVDQQKTENGAKNQIEDDESSKIFDELLEKVKNNEAELTELNVNNSECITIETLMSFTEALEFNTVVKTFSLANTRADDHIAGAIAVLLKSNKTITSINLDSNHITGKGILAIFRALQHNDTLTELRFHNQRHICGGKTEMEIAKMLKENTTLLKLGYHFELAGPRMTVTNLLSRNMDKQRQRRMAEQKALKEAESKKNCLEVPKVVPPPKQPPKSLGKPNINKTQKDASKKGAVPVPPPPPPPMAPLAPPLENIRNSLSPASQRRTVEKGGPVEKNSRDKLLESIRSSNVKQLKKVEVPKWLR